LRQNIRGRIASPWRRLCENNGWAEFSPRSLQAPFHSVTQHALAYGIPALSVANDVTEIYDETGKAVERARKGEGPTLIEVRSERWYGHYVGDAQKYRLKEHVAQAMANDCLLNFEESLLHAKVMKRRDIENINTAIDSEIEEAVRFARESPYPEVSEMMEGLYL
jgi:TPP-dependent pyruvate/acetoin dehydrogenase alpha subunit